MTLLLEATATRLSTRTLEDMEEEMGMVGDAGARTFFLLCTPRKPPPVSLVICPSFFEAKLLLPAEMKLAHEAARRGFATAYLQPPGSGESEGDPNECTIEARKATALSGAAMLRERFGHVPVCFVGARLGGAVALLTAEDDSGYAVAWDPAVEGSAYLRQAKRLHRIAALAGSRGPSRPLEEQIEERGWATLLGNVITTDLHTELLSLSLSEALRSVRSLLVVASNRAERSIQDAAGSEVSLFIHSLGRRDLGHLGFSVEDARASIEPTLDWIGAIDD